MEMLSSSKKMDVTQHALIIQIIILSFVQHGFCGFVDIPGEKRNYTGNSVDLVWKWNATIQKSSIYDFCVFTSDLSSCEMMAEVIFGHFNVKGLYKGRVVKNNPDNTSMGFTLNSLTRSDAGRYRCTLRLGSDAISDNTSLIFIYGEPKQPTITAKPTGNINETGSVRLTCSSTVTSVPAEYAKTLTYIWRRNGTKLSSDDRHDLSSPPDGSVLVIDPVTRDDRVNYRCRAKEQGSILTSKISIFYHIDVLWIPSKPGLHSSPTGDVTEGGSVQLNCTTAEVGEPAARTVWMKDGKSVWLKDSMGRSRYTGSTIDLNPISVSQHDGNWTCSLSNSQTTQPLTSNTVHITVVSAPVVQRHPKNTTIEDSDLLNVSCQYQGKPHVLVEWKKSTTNLLPKALKSNSTTSANGKFTVTTSTLTWNTPDLVAKQRAIGHYQCVGSNVAQSDIRSRQMFLDVTCRPNVTGTDPADKIIAVPLGNSVVFTLYYYANPDAQFRLEFYAVNDSKATVPSNVDIQSAINGFDGTAKLNVTDVRENNFGTYRINASNTVGSLIGGQVSFTLQAHGPPIGPTDLKLERSAPDSMTLSWLRGFDGGPQQTFWINYINLDTGKFYSRRNIPDESLHQNGSINHTVYQGIEPSQQYLFTVGAINTQGNATAYVNATFVSAASSKMVVIVVVVVIVVILLLVAVFAVLVWRGILPPKKDKGKAKNCHGSKSPLVSGAPRAVQMEDGAAINNNHSAAAAAAPRKPVKAKKAKAALPGEEPVEYAQVNKAAKKGAPLVEEEYSQVVKPKKGQGKQKAAPPGQTYENVELLKAGQAGQTYENVEMKEAAPKTSKNLPAGQEIPEETYAEVMLPGDGNAGSGPEETIYQNAEEAQPLVDGEGDKPSLVGPDGTLYADLSFSQPVKAKGKVIHRKEEPTEYASIDFNQQAPVVEDVKPNNKKDKKNAKKK